MAAAIDALERGLVVLKAGVARCSDAVCEELARLIRDQIGAVAASAGPGLAEAAEDPLGQIPRASGETCASCPAMASSSVPA